MFFVAIASPILVTKDHEWFNHGAVTRSLLSEPADNRSQNGWYCIFNGMTGLELVMNLSKISMTQFCGEYLRH